VAFSTEWEDQYQQGKQLAVWPWSHVVSMVMRYSQIKQKPCKILEVGCGAGANLPFFMSHSEQVFAVDGSATIIDKLRASYPSIAHNLQVADFCEALPFIQKFDVIVDRAASTHNDLASIKRFLALAKSSLTNDGVLVIADWFSTDYSDQQFGEALANDPYTKHNFSQGTFKGLGKVHFFDLAHIQSLTEGFEILHLEHVVHTLHSEQERTTASWNVVLGKA